MAYNASKVAVRLMTKSVAVQHAKDKIRANSVHPGIMPPMRTSGCTADSALRAERMRVIPMHRPGEVDEVAYPFCSWLPMSRPTSQVRKFTWMVELSPYRPASRHSVVSHEELAAVRPAPAEKGGEPGFRRRASDDALAPTPAVCSQTSERQFLAPQTR